MIKVRVKASLVRMGDRLMGDAGEPGLMVTQVSARNGEIRLSHGGAQTRLTGDPLVWVMRAEPRVIRVGPAKPKAPPKKPKATTTTSTTTTTPTTTDAVTPPEQAPEAPH